MAFYIGGDFLSPPCLKPPKGHAAVGVHMLLILSPIVPSGGLMDCPYQRVYYNIKKDPCKAEVL